MAAVYTYTNFKDQVFDPLIYPNITSSVTVLNVLNRAARNLLRMVDLRSTKRRAATAPALFDDVYDYAAPTDLKGIRVIDFQPQINRGTSFELNLTTPEEFDRRKTLDKHLIAVSDKDMTRKVRVSVDVDADQLVVSTLDALTSGGGTWTAVGDAESLAADADDYVKAAGSIRWNIGSGGATTAGIQNTGLNSFDFSDYVDNNRSVFHWVKIVSTTNLTNFILRIGSSSSNYYQITVTTTNEGVAFQTGWNLLRFDFANKSTTGSPNSAAGTYASIYMTKDAAKVNETGYRSDHIILQGGVIHDLLYYSKYAWQTSAGVWIENSTATSDFLNADTDEFDLFVLSGKVEAARERRDYKALADWLAELKAAVKEYSLAYPSEAKLLITSRWESEMIQD